MSRELQEKIEELQSQRERLCEEIEQIRMEREYWEKLHHKAAISAMEGLLLGSWEVEEDDEHDKVAIIAKWSVRLADALIAELKKGGI